jgi:hypothetical protein
LGGFLALYDSRSPPYNNHNKLYDIPLLRHTQSGPRKSSKDTCKTEGGLLFRAPFCIIQREAATIPKVEYVFYRDGSRERGKIRSNKCSKQIFGVQKLYYSLLKIFTLLI